MKRFYQWYRRLPRNHWCNRCGPVTKWHEHYPLGKDDLPYQWGGSEWANGGAA